MVSETYSKIQCTVWLKPDGRIVESEIGIFSRNVGSENQFVHRFFNVGSIISRILRQEISKGKEKKQDKERFIHEGNIGQNWLEWNITKKNPDRSQGSYK